jgi:outer membrane protein assembly factor BamA
MINDLYIGRNKLFINLPMNYGFYINKYWGIGDDASDYANAGYSATTFATTLTVQIPTTWFSADRAGIIFDYNYTEVIDRQGNELIDDPLIYGSNGGQIIGIGGDLVWDSRENLFTPKSGNYQYFKAVIYPGVSDFGFAFFEFDVRNYKSFKNGGVLASNFFLQSATGETPFYKLPSLGGKQMRGYFYGRYRDNFYAMTQIEYRKKFAKRWGYVLFGTLGNVAENIVEFDFHTIKYSYGTGLRYMFNKKERVNIRADIGIGVDGNTGIYFGIEEAF